MNLGLNLRFGHEIKVCMMSHETYISLTLEFFGLEECIFNYKLCYMCVLQIVFYVC